MLVASASNFYRHSCRGSDLLDCQSTLVVEDLTYLMVSPHLLLRMWFTWWSVHTCCRGCDLLDGQSYQSTLVEDVTCWMVSPRFSLIASYPSHLRLLLPCPEGLFKSAPQGHSGGTCLSIHCKAWDLRDLFNAMFDNLWPADNVPSYGSNGC
jgi:hypothetical protein